ncbi:beta-phosphoglucomutase [Carnobacterium mobile]|uniref:beta-phosphoglucomutase n=1 Tax=Carnobacterium mobile TaxID=2750 RepID=UPI000558F332|nr:beta-phosphoglucomutase [Carnobacterium mobile]
MIRGVIFDLDGVLVNTAKYHFFAWKELADELDIVFTEQDNERLKGISRMDSLDILLSLGNKGKVYSEEEKAGLAAKKNDRYLTYIETMDSSEILLGIEATLHDLRNKGIKVSLGSASKNAPIILKHTGLVKFFDAIVDGNEVAKAKPNPEVFLLAAEKLGLKSAECVVFEDAEAGCQAAKSAGMPIIGVGKKENLPTADLHIQNFEDMNIETVFHSFN